MTITDTMCVADGGLINPEAFPARAGDLDTSTITESATAMRGFGTAVTDKTDTIHTTWGRLNGIYQAPEQDRVFALMDPAVTSASELKTTFDEVAGHLDTYAAALEGLKSRLASVEERAAAFRASVINGVTVDASAAKDASFGDHMAWAFDWVPGVDQRQVTVPWYEDGASVDKNNALLEEYAGILSEITAAVATAANAINGLVQGMCMAPVEAIPAAAFTAPDAAMPWGGAATEDRNCRESVGKGFSDFGTGLAEGAGMLVLGYNPENGEFFTGTGWGQAWGGLGDLVGSTLLLASPVGWVAAGMAATGNNDNDFSDFMYDRSMTFLSGAGSLIGFDPHNQDDPWHAWKDDAVATGTSTVLNVGTFFIPGAGQVGAGLKTGSISAKVVRIAGAASEFAVQGGSWVVKGGVKIVTGLSHAVRFGLDDVLRNLHPGQVAAAGAGGVRLSPSGLIAMMDDLGHTNPGAHTPPVRSTPVSGDLFGRGPGSHLDNPGSNAHHGFDNGTPNGQHAPGTQGGNTPGAHHGVDNGTGSHGSDGSNGSHGSNGSNGSHGSSAPEWTGDRHPDGRPDIHDVDPSHYNDPRYDPADYRYDGQPRGEHGNIGTVNPDVPSSSGLTLSGRLDPPGVVPEALRPFVDNGTLTVDHGVLRLSDEVQVDFTRRNPNHDLTEFQRQGEMQMQSLKQQTVADWDARLDNFEQNGRSEAAAQKAYREQQIQLRADAIIARADHEISPAQALAQAKQELKGTAALHGPDQRPGGNPLQFTGLGDAGVNGAYGWGWEHGGQADILREAMDVRLERSGIPEHLWDDVRMNVKLVVHDGLAVAAP